MSTIAFKLPGREKEQLIETPQMAPGRRTIIAVDGPAASGKGTLAKRLAERLGYAYLDTGALYRAVALAALEMGVDPALADDVMPALDMIKRNLTPELLSNPALRTAEVSAAASKVAALAPVRQALLDYQRDFAHNPPGLVGGVVLDGRDIGTVICPDADIKFFVTASPEERARRRHLELQATGVSYEKVLDDLRTRDLRDQSRAHSPAVVAEDAYVLDTTDMDAVATMEEAVAIVRSKFLEMTGQVSER